MVRNLYRFYLYIVFIAMLTFAAVSLGLLLQPLLAETSLRGTYGSVPTNADLVQAFVFFVVSWIIALALGGLHYWLIWRDMKSDPAAGSSAIRAFFLNGVELFATPLGVGISGFFVISQLGQNPSNDVTGASAFSIPALLLATVLELERQRTRANGGAALLFQRLHLYGVQLILLVLLSFAWFGIMRQLVNVVAFNGQAFGPCSIEINGCQQPNLLSLAIGTLWIALFWVGYGLLAHNDLSSLLRQVLHFASLAFGAGLVLFGIERALELGLLALFGTTVSSSDFINSYDFLSPITLGLVVIGVYGIWLRMAAKQQAGGVATTQLIAEAITATLLAASFWWGAGLVLLNVFESASGTQLGAHDWAPAVAFVITGLVYVLLDVHLHRRYVQEKSLATGPRHGFVFAMLGGGILAGAIGGAVALYALGTSLLGSPLSNWQHLARTGATAFIVGGVILAIYLWTATREHLLGRAATRPAEPAMKPGTIEDVLDELLAGKITRDEAAAAIHMLTKLPASG